MDRAAYASHVHTQLCVWLSIHSVKPVQQQSSCTTDASDASVNVWCARLLMYVRLLRSLIDMPHYDRVLMSIKLASCLVLLPAKSPLR